MTGKWDPGHTFTPTEWWSMISASQSHYWSRSSRKVSLLLTVALIASAMSTACGASETVGKGAASGSHSPSSSAASASAPTAIKATEAFVALAEGTDSAAVPWSERVAYYIGSNRIADLKREELPDALRSCPPGKAEYEGRACPVSPLATIAGMAKEGGVVVVEADAPTTVGCTKVKIPDETRSLTAASVRPSEKDRDCFKDFAVTLFTDVTGNVTAIEFTLSSP